MCEFDFLPLDPTHSWSQSLAQSGRDWSPSIGAWPAIPGLMSSCSGSGGHLCHLEPGFLASEWAQTAV